MVSCAYSIVGHPRAAAERVRGGFDLDRTDIERWTRVTLRGGPK
jgi:hypothetical protein